MDEKKHIIDNDEILICEDCQHCIPNVKDCFSCPTCEIKKSEIYFDDDICDEFIEKLN